MSEGGQAGMVCFRTTKADHRIKEAKRPSAAIKVSPSALGILFPGVEIVFGRGK